MSESGRILIMQVEIHNIMGYEGNRGAADILADGCSVIEEIIPHWQMQQ